jgi:predicted metalloprotease
MARTDGRLLTAAAEEIQLAKRIERGDRAAKREMIERNPRLRFLEATTDAVQRADVGRRELRAHVLDGCEVRLPAVPICALPRSAESTSP